MELLILFAPAILLVAIVVTLLVLGQRSLDRQRGNKLQRGESESRAARRGAMGRYFHW